MKKLLLFLAIPFCAIGQHNFEVVNEHITWTQTWLTPIDTAAVIPNIKTKIKHDTAPYFNKGAIYGSTGFVDLIRDKSDLGAIFRQPFAFRYKIEKAAGRYRVYIRDIIFKNIEVEIYGVKTTSDPSIESFLLRTRDGELRKNKNAQRTLERLNEVFLKLFNPDALSDDGW